MTNEGMTGASADAVELLTRQHREVDQLWSQLQAAGAADGSLRKDLARRIVTLLSQHDAIETQLLYPAVRKVAGGEQLADEGLHEHQRVRELLKQVDGKDPADTGVFATLRECMGLVEHHVQEEETEMFPKLRERLGEQELTDLGHTMEKALRLAPTHPHPSTPNNPVGAAVAGAVTGIFDRARDAIRK